MSKIKLSKEEIIDRISTDPEFINSPKHKYNLDKLLKSNPNGVNDQFASNLLMMTLDDFHIKFKNVINKYRQKLKINLD